jgi:hypothetical protein
VWTSFYEWKTTFRSGCGGFDLAAKTQLTEPTVLEIDAATGKLISSWGANLFMVPHGITVDAQDNVFLTDVSLQQVFKFTHDGKLIFALGEPRVGAWDATHFNEPTDIAVRPDGTFLCLGWLREQPGRALRPQRKMAAGMG